MIRATVLLLLATPALADTSLPARMTCDWVAVCEPDITCAEQAGPFPTFTLEVAGDSGLWDPQAGWQGFPVMIAATRVEALDRHLIDNLYGLVLIPSGTTADGEIILDGFGLTWGRRAHLEATIMRHHCRAVSEVTS